MEWMHHSLAVQMLNKMLILRRLDERRVEVEGKERRGVEGRGGSGGLQCISDHLGAQPPQRQRA